MSYYDALIAKWATAPAGTTDEKLVWINAQTVTGPAVPMVFPAYKIYNLVDPTEFGALSAANQQLVRDIISMGEVDASPGTNVRTRLTALFGPGTATRTALSGLAATFDAPLIPWWSATVQQGGGGLVAPVKHSDLTQAGLS